MDIFGEDDKKKATTHEVGSDLSMLSVDELEERIEILRAEINRLEDEQKSKSQSKLAAESIFKS